MAVQNFQFAIFIILVMLSLVSGFWLSMPGKPMNSARFNIHKLIALAALIFAVMAHLPLISLVKFPSVVPVLTVCLGLIFIVMFFTGALLHLKKATTCFSLIVHRIGSGLLIIDCVALYFSYFSRTYQ